MTTTALNACDRHEPNAPPGVDETALLLAVLDHDESLVRVNAEPLLSKHGVMVNVWVSPEQAVQYESLDPSNSTATRFPEGTLIAKEQLDEDLQPFSATVMYKGPAGYNPETKDWWFATVDLRDREFVETGPDLPNCATCHADAAATDFIFGLPHESKP